MRKYLFYLILFIIPLIFFITGCILKDAQGPYYLNFYDPSYVYLISSLNLTQGFAVGHFDHPGTTVQVIGAVCTKLQHLFGSGNPDIVLDVLSRPEDYLFTINRILMGINSVTLFLFGILVYRITKNLPLALMLQLSPFVSMEIFYGMIIVTPDNFLISATLLLIGLLIYYLYKVDKNKRVPLRLIVAFAVVCGLGMATKLNFLPLVLIPFFLIKGIKDKFFFIFILILSFTIFILPSMSNLNSFIAWVQRLVIFNGKYGTGESTVINPSTFPINLKWIFKYDPFFTATYIVMAITFLTVIFKKKSPLDNDDFFQKSKRLLIIIFLSVSLEIILVAKQYAQYYMIPSFMLCVLSLFLCSIILLKNFQTLPRRITQRHVLLLIIFLVSSLSLWQLVGSYQEATQQRTEAFRVGEFITDKYPDAMVIPVFQSANRECALAFSTAYGGSQTEKYKEVISKQQSHIFYNPWTNKFYDISNGDIKNSLLGERKIILQNGTWFVPAEFIKALDEVCGVKGSSLKKVFQNNFNETVSEVSIGN